jgi:hypothetical protein
MAYNEFGDSKLHGDNVFCNGYLQYYKANIIKVLRAIFLPVVHGENLSKASGHKNLEHKKQLS